MDLMVDQPPVASPASYWPGNNTATDPPYQRSGKTRKDLLKTYGQRLDVAKKWREDQGYDKTWKRLIDLYRNKQFNQVSDEDRIVVNIAFSTVNVIVPSVAVNHPQITVNARRPETQMASQAAEAMLNYWWRHFGWRSEVQRAVKDSLICGHGWAKVGWKYTTISRATTPQEQDNEYQNLVQQAGDAAQANPGMAADLPSDEQIRENIPLTIEEAEVDVPFVERVSPFDLFVDPEATCVEDMKWIAQKLVVPLEEVRKNQNYRQSARLRLTADVSMNVRYRDGDTAAKEYTDDVQRVTLYEFYDLRHKFYCVFAGNQAEENFLVEPTELPYPFGHPFVYLPNHEVPDQFYSLGDLEAIEPLQMELNATRSDMVNHRKRWQRAYLVKRDRLDTQAQNSLLSNKDNRIIYVDGDEDLGGVIVPVPQLPLQAEMYQHSQIIEDDVDLVSGVSDYMRGGQSEIRRTATEASIIQDASNARAADKLAQVEIFMAEIAERVLQLAQTYLTGQHMARIVGLDGATAWQGFDNSSIQGEFDMEVEAGSTQPRNETFRRQQALQLANVLSPYVGIAVNPQVLVAYILKEGFGVKNPEDFLVAPQPLMPPGTDPNAMGGGPPPGAGPTDNPQQALTLPEAGPGSIPPNILAQLQGQVGLEVGQTP